MEKFILCLTICCLSFASVYAEDDVKVVVGSGRICGGQTTQGVALGYVLAALSGRTVTSETHAI